MSKSDISLKFKNKKIGVLYGGLSAERAVSLRSGKAVLSSLKKLGFKAVGIIVDRNIAQKIKQAKIDIAFLVLHGQYGEDGGIQGMLEIMGIPYTGCGIFASAASMDKNISKVLFKAAGINTADWFVLKRFEEIPKIKKYPVIVKPIIGGSTIGINIAKNEKEFLKAAKEAFKYDNQILIEDFIKGKEITVAVLDGKALPVIEIIPKGGFYDYKAKYQKGGSQHLIPARIDKFVYEQAQKIAQKIYRVFNCKSICRADMIVDNKNKIWVLENNTMPGMTATSLVPDAAKYDGMSFEDVVLKILNGIII
ncbi:MAG: D-alanine--D-alanine ligase [Elusimicrobiota bacterium]|jgi:D-alanine-D-alanine ligase|nr:D-alanine--D-alanine ligase [Elusimicrobiota bacterium]